MAILPPGNPRDRCPQNGRPAVVDGIFDLPSEDAENFNGESSNRYPSFLDLEEVPASISEKNVKIASAN